jgi:hypothetical protein
VHHKLDKVFFSILDSKLNDEFYNKKMKLNPSDDTLLAGFTTALRKWINSTTPESIVIESAILETHFKYDRLNNMAKLLEVIDKS